MMEDRRPDPDLLLRHVQKEEERKHEGKLKIFFGAAPGVGKTYSMLQAARQRKEENLDVLSGIVETHGRRETEALLEGLDILPLRQIEYRGVNLREFDLDAALARKPQIILVDELAHTNAPGSRHKKRWQDVLELLAAGINVYTTVNVQHLESLNDVISQITSVVMKETLPDSVLDQADEIELIDLPPAELLQRLREGKVYVPELAEQARKNFFRKGNLIALRELALRRTAERVDAQMESYRHDWGVKEVWPAAEKILVCVGPNPSAIRLIRAAKRMAAGLRASWIAATVEAPSKVRLKENDLKQLAEHMRLAESLGAETATLSGIKSSEEILNYARSRNVTKIIIGKPSHPRWKDKLFGSTLDEVVRGSGDIDVYVITGDITGQVEKRSAVYIRPKWKKGEWVISFLTVAACTATDAILFPYFELIDLAMIYLLGVVFVSSKTGKLPAFIATVLSVLAFDFFFIPPYFSFAVSDGRHVLTFGFMFFIGYIISGLTLRIREQADAARQRERRTAALYSLSKELVHERGIERLSATAVKHISEVFSCQTVILIPDENGRLIIPATGQHTFALDQREEGVAQWAYDHRERAGLGTDTLPGAKALYLPLIAASRTVGVLGILPGPVAEPFDPDQYHALESFANQTAMAIERGFLVEEAQQALLKAETEALRNTLLSSVSHDLRTPLAAITGASTTLLQQEVVLDQAGRQELLKTIYEEAEHLNQIIRNVLDMIKLESGAIKIKKEWQSLEEIVGVTINRLSEKIRDRQLIVKLPEDLPLIPFDPLLIEQALMNLLENALKYTPQGTPIELSASVKKDSIEVELADRGPGIRHGGEEEIFDKFVRGSHAGGGMGLGLTICRAIITAHGGRIWAENREGGGAVFRFTLPIQGQPQMPEPEE
jgi:two-component system sensor histidine kinase KdpD